MARKDWKKAAQDALEDIRDRFREALDALDGLLAPPPEPVPVPVRPHRGHRPR